MFENSMDINAKLMTLISGLTNIEAKVVDLMDSLAVVE